MSKDKERYINPLTDFGFKKLFGTEPNKMLLIDLLNQILPDRKIKDLSYSSVFTHLSQLQDRPKKLQNRVFTKLFEAAEIAKFTPKEREAYEESLKYYRDIKNVVDTSREEGVKEGIEKTAKKMKIEGFTNEQIKKITGLTDNEIEKL